MNHSPQAAAANAKRLEGEKVAGGRTFRVGQRVNVRIYDGAHPRPATVLATETGGGYGNIARVRYADGTVERVVVARVTKAK